MKTLAASFAALAATAAGLTALSAPAEAQTQSMMEIIVYGDDPCPRSSDAEIVVCVRRPDADRYRIPEAYSTTGNRQTRNAWVNQARTLEMVSDTGTFSCSAVGPGGHTGCLQQLIRQSTSERIEESELSNPPM